MDQPARNAHDRAVRWRQLVDLLARGGSIGESAYARAALDILYLDLNDVDLELRSAAARAIAALPLPFELILLFAGDDLKISAPILASATLTPGEWAKVLDAASEEIKKFILALHPAAERRAVPRPAQATRQQQPSPDEPTISEVIARIERLRESRRHAGSEAESNDDTAQRPQDDSPALFRWECNPTGELAWVEGAPRGALIGRTLIDPARLRDLGNDEIGRAFTLRAPFRNAVMTLGDDGALAGEWQLSGVPAFEPATGRFAGYRGIARRSSAAVAKTDAPHPDLLRELVHEIKTPLNAIMGFAEIIEQQMFGPADEAYRGRAAEIVTQSNRLLSAIDDLDFAAKSGSAAVSQGLGADLAVLVEGMATSLEEAAAARGVRIDRPSVSGDFTAAIDPALAERLIFRLCISVIERSGHGDRLRLELQQNEQIQVSISRPTAYWGLTDAELFGEAKAAGEHFWLRLTRSLAQIAGGDLVTSAETFALLFPRRSLGVDGSQAYGTGTGRGL